MKSKHPGRELKQKLQLTTLEKWRKHDLILNKYSSLECRAGRTSLSHVVGVLQICYLISCAGG